MAELRTPGVYCKQVDSLSRPLQAVGTRVAAFVGEMPDATKDVGIARPINDWPQFVKNYFPEGSKPTDTAYAIYGFFACGGNRCYVSNIGKDGTVAGDAKKGDGVRSFDTYDEISMVAAPGYTDAASYRALVDHAEKHQDRIAILDCVPEIDNVARLTEVAVGEKPSGQSGDAGGTRSRPAKSKARGAPRSSFAACYFPHLVVAPQFGEKENVIVPPSGHIAGLYAMNDAMRGVHWSPAGYTVPQAINLSQRVDHDQQGLLNEKGVNCIRHFRDGGIKVWGARTLSDDPQWRYVNVRRLYMMLRETLEEQMVWAVFCPNDATTRKTVEFSCRAFLKLQWMNGALVGKTEEDAFFVECNDAINPPESVEAGILNVKIGFCPSRPAEFIVIHLGLSVGNNPSES
ncbi:MAG: phage tail sheath subtilisin-like domain-containing protein [Gammaproteobacteria bacterium]|nr:phage tail sheath subtilisin-like domain-containing protein [Gammaproteobacteria bacterium]